ILSHSERSDEELSILDRQIYGRPLLDLGLGGEGPRNSQSEAVTPLLNLRLHEAPPTGYTMDTQNEIRRQALVVSSIVSPTSNTPELDSTAECCAPGRAARGVALGRACLSSDLARACPDGSQLRVLPPWILTDGSCSSRSQASIVTLSLVYA